MGIGNKRPPLPAPTEDPTDEGESVVQTTGRMDDSATDVGTNVSRRTDATSYTVPEDGRSITIPYDKKTILSHGRNKSQTSLLIEYFEASKSGVNGGRPSVRVKVTPSSKRKNKSGGHDAVQITGIGKDRKPSYTRRISLGSKNPEREARTPPIEGTEVSQSSESNLSGRPPVEVEILNHGGSDLSNNNSRISRDLRYLSINPSEVSSMPPDSLYDASEISERPHSPLIEETTKSVIDEHLHAPQSRDRSRSISRERITQKVMEKLKQQRAERPVEYEPDNKPTKERRRRSSKSHHTEETMTGSSLLSSSLNPSQTSYRSGGTSKVSLNNPKLLEMVEDTVRRLILPEIDQLKNEQRTERNHRDFDSSNRDSYTDSRDSYSEDLGRRLSKSSSSPNMASKPKVVLNRYDDHEGEVLSRGDSERRVDPDRKKIRKSSRESVPASERSERHSSRGHYDETSVHRKKSKDSGHKLRDTAAAGIAGGILTAAALRHHDSKDSDSMSREKRKTRTRKGSQGSRSRSTSIAETKEEHYRKEDIPPMPFLNSAFNESDVTRTSLLSDATERPPSRHSEETRTPIREVSRGSLSQDVDITPTARTPTQSTAHKLGASSSHHSFGETVSTRPHTPVSITTKARIAALAAAGLGAAEMRHKVEDRHTPSSPRSPLSQRYGSPAQSVSSVKDNLNDPLIPQGLRPRSNLSYASPGAQMDHSLHSVHSETSARELEEHLRPVSDVVYDDPGTPREDMEEWFQKQHEENERYRQSMASESALTGSVDDRRHTLYTNDTYSSGGETSPERDVRGVGVQPQYVHTPHGVESAVASLMEPSMISASTGTDTGSSGRYEEITHQHHMGENLHDINRNSPAPHEMNAIAESEETSPMKSRWSALREQAQALSNKNSPHGSSGVVSPLQSDPHSLREHHSVRESTPVKMSASGFPIANDPMPEIGHGLDEASETSTNPPEIRGAKAKGSKDRWSYDTDGFLKDRNESRESMSDHSSYGGQAIMTGAGLAAAGLAAEHAITRKDVSHSPHDVSHRSSVMDDYNRGPTPGVHQAEAVYLDRADTTPVSPPAQHGDEGYASAAHALSAGGLTPKERREKEFTKEQLAEYEAAMGRDDDPFVSITKKHNRHFSANSHGLASPPYDSAMGKGIDRIQSEDVVALMDHLTVRDGARNARDTEILITLVRNAAEMRNEFEAMKRFIAEQDKMIMHNTDRDAEITVQKVLSGPRPMPGGATATPARSPRASYESDYRDEYSTKKKSLFKRALKGLSGGKNNDLGRIEDMLNQLLGDVEVLKTGSGGSRPPMSLRTDSMDSYDRARGAGDSGYEPEGQAGTSSTPNHSGGQLNLTPTREKYFHSGYDGRRNSVNRVSTVMEEASDSSSILDPHEAQLLDNQFEGNERLLTPTQETFNRRSGESFNTPPAVRNGRDHTPDQQTPEKQRKHKSNSSSLFAGIPKLSRWSKTTASTDQDYKRKSNQSYQSYQSNASRSGDSLARDDYHNNAYAVQSDDRLRSTQSLARQQEAEAASLASSRSSALTRTPSPLMPSETGVQHNRVNEPLMSGGAGHPSPVHELRQQNLDHLDRDSESDSDLDSVEFDDPKYQAHRNSLLLQHPQPRPGPTHRHQTNLENEARTFSGEVGSGLGLTDSDLSQKTTTSESSEFDPATWGSAPALSLPRMNKIAPPVPAKDDGPLMPQTKARAQAQPSARQQQLEREREEAEYARYEREEEEERMRRESNQPQQQPRHAYDRMYYSSPLGSGHLLEPIPEIRSSLETDRSIVRSPDPSIRASPALNNTADANAAGGANKGSPARKITGPRPMGSRSPSKEGAPEESVEEKRSGTVRRKPVARGSGSSKMTHKVDEEEEEGGWGTWKGGRQA